MNKQVKLGIVLLVLVNIVIVGWLQLRPGATNDSNQPQRAVLDDLLQDNTMAAARYDLSKEASKLNVILISLDALRYDSTGLSGNQVSPQTSMLSLKRLWSFTTPRVQRPGPCRRRCPSGLDAGLRSTRSPTSSLLSQAARWSRPH